MGKLSEKHMPQGMAGLPGMTGMATKMLKKQIADLDVPEVPEFLQMLADMGGQLWACKMSVDMMGLDQGRPVRRGRRHHQRQRVHRALGRRTDHLHLSGSTVRRIDQTGWGPAGPHPSSDWS